MYSQLAPVADDLNTKYPAVIATQTSAQSLCQRDVEMQMFEILGQHLIPAVVNVDALALQYRRVETRLEDTYARTKDVKKTIAPTLEKQENA